MVRFTEIWPEKFWRVKKVVLPVRAGGCGMTKALVQVLQDVLLGARLAPHARQLLLEADDAVLGPTHLALGEIGEKVWIVVKVQKVWKALKVQSESCSSSQPVRDPTGAGRGARLVTKGRSRQLPAELFLWTSLTPFFQRFVWLSLQMVFGCRLA